MRKIRQYLFYLGFRLIAFVVAALPVGATWPLFQFFATRASQRANAQTSIVRQNLSHVVKSSEQELDSMVREAFVSYALYWHELFRLNRVRLGDINPRVDVVGEKYLNDVLSRGNGAILALPHVGNWELSGGWMTLRGTPIAVVAEMLEPRALFNWFTSTRNGLGMDVYPLSSSATTEMLKALDSNITIGLLCDRDIADSGIEVSFFGEKTKMPGGPSLLAARSGAGIIPTAVYFLENRRIEINFMEPIYVAKEKSLRDAVDQGTQKVTSALEELIKKHPEQWHMFQSIWPNQ